MNKIFVSIRQYYLCFSVLLSFVSVSLIGGVPESPKHVQKSLSRASPTFCLERSSTFISNLFFSTTFERNWCADRLRRRRIELAYPALGSVGEGGWRALARKPPAREAARNRNPGLRVAGCVIALIELRHRVRHEKRSLEHIGSRGPTLTSKKALK